MFLGTGGNRKQEFFTPMTWDTCLEDLKISGNLAADSRGGSTL